MNTRRNRAKCRKCGDIIESKFTHNYVTCKCGAISVDGGREYIRRGFSDFNDIIELNDDDTERVEEEIEENEDW